MSPDHKDYITKDPEYNRKGMYIAKSELMEVAEALTGLSELIRPETDEDSLNLCSQGRYGVAALIKILSDKVWQHIEFIPYDDREFENFHKI